MTEDKKPIWEAIQDLVADVPPELWEGFEQSRKEEKAAYSLLNTRKVYVIRGRSGEYSDTCEWMVRAYTTCEAATKWVDMMNSKVSKIRQIRQKWITLRGKLMAKEIERKSLVFKTLEDHTEFLYDALERFEKRSEKLLEHYDPYLYDTYEGIDYEVEEVDLVLG